MLWRKSNRRIIFKFKIFHPKYINLSGNHQVSTSPALTPNYSLSMRSSTSQSYILCSRIDKWPAAGVTKPLRFYGEWGFYEKWPADLESARKDKQNGIFLIEDGAFYKEIDFSRKIIIFWSKSVILPHDFPSFKMHRIEKWDHVWS